MIPFLGAAATRPRRNPPILQLAAALAFGGIVSLAHGTCVSYDLTNISFGQIVTDNGLPNGASLASRATKINVTCSGKGTQTPTLYFKAPKNISQSNADFWPTTQKGVGLRVWLNDKVISTSQEYSENQKNDGTPKTYRIKVDLIKTGQISPTSSFSPELLRLSAKNDTAQRIYEVGRLTTSATSFSGIACTIDNDSLHKEIQLGEHQITEFSRIGKVVGEKKFKLNLRCDGVWPIPNTKYSVRFEGPSIPGQSDLLRLTGAPPASGIGIRLKWGDSSQIRLNSWIAQGVVSSPGRKTLDLSAGYYQYNKKVTPGGANGQVTFMIQMR